jgi:hypothetical protein
MLRVITGILIGVASSFPGLGEVLREPIISLIYRDFFSREVSGLSLCWVLAESSGRESSEDMFYRQSVELAKNRFPANYFFPKIYERKKNEKKRRINTLLRWV